MCCCNRPNINGQDGYSWDGVQISTRPVDPPALEEGDQILFDEPGRCGGMDSHSHHYRLVRAHGTVALLVKHGGGGQKRVRLSLPRGEAGPLEALDSNARYWLLNAIWHASVDGEQRGAQATEREYRAAFVDGRLKKRKMREQGKVKVWIEGGPAVPTVSTQRSQYIIESHPLVRACRLVTEKSNELLKDYRATVTKAKMNAAWEAYDLARRVGNRLADQISATPGCWVFAPSDGPNA